MSRYPYGSHRDPLLIQHDRHAQPNGLHEAKLAAWAFAIGAHGPGGDPPGGRRPHRGGLADVFVPEPPAQRRRPRLLGRLAEVVTRLLAAARPASPATAMAADAEQGIGPGAEITYIDRTNAVRSAAAPADGGAQPIRSRAA